MHNWTIKQSKDIYNIEHWSQGYFDINANGSLVVHPLGKENSNDIELQTLVKDIIKSGIKLPVLIRFKDILRHRLFSLQEAFSNAIEQNNFKNEYTTVYPIKVNQQHDVIETIVTKTCKNVGLEAGSKPELMAVMASAKQPNTTIICNGYKDREYIRLALIGQQMGYRVFIIIEKPSELSLILEEAKVMGIKPLLGVRVRLASAAKGKWQNSGGQRSKFGLSSMQLLELVQRLHELSWQDCLSLLHFHMGSQIPNIRDIQQGIQECARYFAELWELGVKIRYVDVGGGLGVDYEGTKSRSFCSINYLLQEYANNIVMALSEICEEKNLPHPHIITETGRALTAHHAVLVTNITEVETHDQQGALIPMRDDDKTTMKDLYHCLEKIPHRTLTETYHDACHYISVIQSMFMCGAINLSCRARAEHLYSLICLDIKRSLNITNKVHREILDEINERLADKIFCNFSLFQSLPDSWAIDQIFPVMPLFGLQNEPTRRGIVHDITCDSDGRIDYYIDNEGLDKTLRLPPYSKSQDNLLGFFLVGAYQEILGDMHNLFGDANAVNVELDANGSYNIVAHEVGDSIDSVLSYVHFKSQEMLESYKVKLDSVQLTIEQRQEYLQMLNDCMSGDTYLEVT